MNRPRLGAVFFALMIAWLAAAAPALGTTTKMGAVQEIGDGTPPFEPSGGGDAVQVAEAMGTYAVPAGYGVITAWEHRTGSASGPMHFKVYRPTGVVGRFYTVASETHMVSSGATHVFAARIPVNPGDRLGLSSLTGTTQIAYLTFNILDKFAFFPVDSNPPPGTTVNQDGPPASTYKLDVAARVESDADRDGYGDDTQDLCPSSASTHGPCKGGSSLPSFSGCSPKIANVIRGSSGSNTIDGTSGRDRIFAGRGNDRVEGHGGSDCIALEAGTDRAYGGSGNDLVAGGAGGEPPGGESREERPSGGAGEEPEDRGRGGGAPDRGGGARARGGGGGGTTRHPPPPPPR